MRQFCTLCDVGYLARLSCLRESLVAHDEPFRLYVLCFDAATQRAVAAWADCVAIPLGDLLDADRELAAVRARRTQVEFFFTATPAWVRWCLQREPAAQEVTYLDADLYFFGPPSAVLAEQRGASVAIVPHRFPARLSDRLKYGTYNVGWVSFRADADGLRAVEWWRARCLEWCHDRAEAGRFADQGYLDEFPDRFGGVRVVDHPGINAGPWNIGESRVTTSHGRVAIAGQPLLLYHFQGLREVAPGWFEPGLHAYGNVLSRELRELVYAPYVRRLAAAQRRLRREQGLAAAVGAPRLNASESWADRRERIKTRWLLPVYGRMFGRLVHAAP